MLKQRLLTVAIVLPLFLMALFAAPSGLWGSITGVICLIAAWEWSRLARMGGLATWLYLFVFGIIGYLAYHLEVTQTGGLFASTPGWIAYLVVVAFWALWVPLWLRLRWPVGQSWQLGLMGLVVLIPLWHSLYILQSQPWKLLALMAVVWVADTAAYAFGRLFGRHKLALAISPGKTWEGAAGAAMMVLVYVFALATLFPDVFPGVVPMLAIGVMMLILSIEGDLLESWMKRVAGVKDSGKLLPGHGGVLDRIDALTGALPIAVFVLWWAR